MTDALEDHQGTVSIGGRTITNLRFADDIDGLAGKEEELASLVDHVDKTSAAFDMEISAEKTKLMTNNATGISIDIKINSEKLGEVDSFKYLGAVVTDQGFKPEVLSRIAQKTAALMGLKIMLLRGGGQGISPGYFQMKIEPKETPSCLIPHPLVVFTQQLEILVTTLYFI